MTMLHTETELQLHLERIEHHFPGLNYDLGHRAVYLIRADMAGVTGAFKEFGVQGVVQAARSRGAESLLTASAGSHALSVAYFGARTGMNTSIVLPETAPQEKIDKIRDIWDAHRRNDAELQLLVHGHNVDASLDYALNSGEFDTAGFIHPFDNPELILGRQAIYRQTVGQLPNMTDIISPVGGGSLYTATTLAAHEDGRQSWAVEAEGSDSLSKSLRLGSLEPLEATAPNRKYGGSSVRRTGRHVLRALSQFEHQSDFFVTANDRDVKELAEQYESFYRPEITLEPTSLVAIAGLKKILPQLSEDAVVGIIATGHNEPYTNLLQAA